MITLFRRIRQKLIDSGSVTKYLLYAIGEILLVVVGILIALQVNNWNEERVRLEREANLLINLEDEFTENLIILNKDIAELDTLFDSLETILEIMHDGPGDLSVSEFEILLEKTFVNPSWEPSSIILEELKNSGGFSQLSNAELRTALFEWERGYLALKSTEESYDSYASEYILYLTDYGSPRNLDAINGSIPNLRSSTITRNELSLLKDPKFEGRVDNFYFLANALLKSYQEASAKMESIILLTQ